MYTQSEVHVMMEESKHEEDAKFDDLENENAALKAEINRLKSRLAKMRERAVQYHIENMKLSVDAVKWKSKYEDAVKLNKK